jgi:hypothetical protein
LGNSEEFVRLQSRALDRAVLTRLPGGGEPRFVVMRCRQYHEHALFSMRQIGIGT